MAVQTLPVYLDLTVYAGTSFRREFRWRPAGTDGQDFTGWTASFRIGPAQGVPFKTITDATGITLGSDGTFIVAMSPTDTDALTAGTFFYVLDLTNPDGFVLRLLRGRLNVVRDLED